MPPRRIALFGGTFDPPHIGHLVVASEVRYAGGFDEVLLVVANDPWQKRGTRDVTPAAARLEMVEAAVAGHDGLTPCAIEIDRGGASYTIDTVEELRAGGDVECTLVLGADAVAGLDSWHRSADLARLVDVVVVRRPGHSTVDASAGWRMRPVDVPAIDVSSTAIRERCATGAPIDFLVPDGVRSVITALGLYGVRR